MVHTMMSVLCGDTAQLLRARWPSLRTKLVSAIHDKQQPELGWIPCAFISIQEFNGAFLWDISVMCKGQTGNISIGFEMAFSKWNCLYFCLVTCLNSLTESLVVVPTDVTPSFKTKHIPLSYLLDFVIIDSTVRNWVSLNL